VKAVRLPIDADEVRWKARISATNLAKWQRNGDKRGALYRPTVENL
jgi:hypothetical protein